MISAAPRIFWDNGGQNSQAPLFDIYCMEFYRQSQNYSNFYIMLKASINK